MRREWDVDDLVTWWTLVEADLELLAGKHGSTRLSFAVMLKFFEVEGRFPRHAGEIPPAAVEYVSRQMGLDDVGSRLEVSGRSAERHRAQIRAALGFRVFGRGDEDKMISWLAEQVCPSELNADRQREAVLARCRAERLEPPGRMDRIIGAANRIADDQFCAATLARLSTDVAAALQCVIAVPGVESGSDEAAGGGDGAGEASFFTELKSDPGRLGLETLLAEITKLNRVRAIGLGEGLFVDVAEQRLARWRARALAEFPSTLRRDHRPEVSLTLLAVLCWCRLAELTDSLVDLFIDLVRTINTRAERRVDKEQMAEFRRVGDKENVLFKLAAAALEHPDERVRTALFPVVGESTLRDLAAEAKATETRRGSDPGADGPYRVVLPALPLDVAEAAGRAGVPQQQQCLPAGDERGRAAAPLQGPRRPAHPLRRG